MVGCFVAVDTKAIRRLEADPSQLDNFLYPDDGGSEPPNYHDVDKAWHCIHFMLCGSYDKTETPLSWAILGGTEIGDDVGYGPARILEPEQVQAVANAITKINGEAFKLRYEPKKLKEADIYLAEMCVSEGAEALDYLSKQYLGLVTFYQDAAKRGDGVVAWLC